MSEFYIRDCPFTEEQIASITQEQYIIQNLQKIPSFFYKYFPNTVDSDNGRNYSVEALESNTVFMQNPRLFDDPFDSLVLVDELTYATGIIKDFARLYGIAVEESWDYYKTAHEFGLKIYNDIKSGKSFDDLYEKCEDDTQIIRLKKENFFLSLKNQLLIPNNNGDIFAPYIKGQYAELYHAFDKFRMACFTLTPFSILMWSHYADNHKGFCIEYETSDFSDDNKHIYSNLYPVIYTDKRVDLADIYIESDKKGNYNAEQIWAAYKYGFLCKSIDWKYQKEWRLISLDKMITDDNNCCKFFKIKKVYLGNKMKKEEREKIISLCKSKGISYAGVIIHPNRFEMIECNQLCENCINLDSHTTDNEKRH